MKKETKPEKNEVFGFGGEMKRWGGMEKIKIPVREKKYGPQAAGKLHRQPLGGSSRPWNFVDYECHFFKDTLARMQKKKRRHRVSGEISASMNHRTESGRCKMRHRIREYWSCARKAKKEKAKGRKEKNQSPGRNLGKR